ncbi:MAG: adenylate/guanylate cyclase domain-containing protein [Chloroflexi bacterium]|nr:MAG: adenylate/guanylate cyclase domain-containing protein [Chloroflexota bacterium]
MELRMQYATTRDGVRIAFGTAGKGSPLIVRVPSLPFVHSQLEWSQGSEFFDQLAENWTVVQYDPRGTGLSDRDVHEFSMQKRLLDLEAVAGKLGLERFVLHGIGWGGPIAVTYAVQNPDRVSHLILDDTQARTEDFFNVPQMRALDQLTTDWDAFLEYLAFMIYGVGREAARPVVEFFRAGVTQEKATLISAGARQDDVNELLPAISMPTLVLSHSAVSKQYLEAARDMAARIPDARLVMLDGLPTADLAKLIGAIGDLLGTETRAAERARSEGRREESGVRTILFTDMVEHTPMMHRLGDKAGRDVLREHENLTRDILRVHGGSEVKSMGDGFMASFASPAGAVECAITLQRAFEELHHGPGADPDKEPIHIRIGLNASEPIEEGGDLFGATVIMASRIAAHANTGEILASDVVRGLCSGKGFLFADRGENVLRGFEDAVRLFEISWQQ